MLLPIAENRNWERIGLPRHVRKVCDRKLLEYYAEHEGHARVIQILSVNPICL